jgi:phage terminase large subunit-like protein
LAEWGCVGAIDLDDPAVWPEANPALGIRLDPATVADERASMDDATFARERLGVWSSPAGYRVISAQTWATVAQPNLAASGGQVALSLDVSPDRSVASLAAAGWTAGEQQIPFVDVIETRQGEPDWAVHRIADMWTRHDARAVVIDGMSAANNLIDPMRRADVTVTVTTATQMAKACGDCMTL